MNRSGQALAAAMAALVALEGCAPARHEAGMGPSVLVEEPPPQEEWRSVATPDDADRIDRLDEAWRVSLEEARSRGYRRAIASEAELLDPDAALPRAAPPPGPYYCRTIKLGRQGRGRPFAAYKPFFCYVDAEENILTFVKQTGSQRPAGRIYGSERGDRLVFLGTLAVDGEEEHLPYGEEAERDMAGIVERVAPFRYRVVFPWPRLESKLDVIELIPVTD